MRGTGGTVDQLTRWQPDLASRRVDARRIEDIAFTPMRSRLRNELITRAYGDIAQEMDELLGRNDATWAGFGQWASSTVGGFLTLPVPGLSRLIARAFADGNRDVFADIGRGHVVFLETVGAAHRRHAGTDAGLLSGQLIDAWLDCRDTLSRRSFEPPGRPGGTFDHEPEPWNPATPQAFWTETGDPRLEPDRKPDDEDHIHNPWLIRGLRAYYDALNATDDEERSRQILLGNILLALHEQKLLALAISFGFRSWLRALTTPFRLMSSRVKWRQRDPGAWRLRLEDWWIRFATRRFVNVRLPHRKVRCGKPVPAGTDPVRIKAAGVAGTVEPTSPTALGNFDADQVLTMLWLQFAVDGRSATCWNDLADRMAYIMALFAEHQRASYWRDDYGKPIRPKTWRPFDRELRKLNRRLDERAGRGVSTSVPSPVADRRLDELRQLPTHEPVRASEFIELDIAANEDREEFVVATQKGLALLEQQVGIYWDDLRRPGEFLSPENRAVAHAMFQDGRTLCFIGLLVRSLTDSYSAAAGVEVLGQVSDLATDPFRRAGETAQFVEDLLIDPAAWEGDVATAPALRSILGVRRMHSIISNHLVERGWDTDTLGLPINQEDTVGAALTFGVATVELFDSLNPDLLTDEQRDAFTQFWIGVGVLMGAPLDAFYVDEGGTRRPARYPDARSLALAIRRRHRLRSLSGIRLTEALVEGISDGFPRPFYWVSSGIMLGLGEPQVNTILLTANGRGRRRALAVGALFRFVLRVPGLRRIGRWAIERVGDRWLMPFLEQGRTRPYRRPSEPSDDDRLAIAALDAQRWPVSCERSG